ncbi:MAG: proton-conducting transporter membrane subunit [Sulfurimonas sp.]|uniref:proton-conducting transporter transmembrane domain-containing protein n=1 Tax=Sulfurimonas sp. TaxID=2022749 RepID=UPI0026150A50|nr:proton-conducting transporter membrane subunit [Sulfurimonas sp.]MCW8894335.1 proton-conducting transporter membrane subunit [Sulfurimonas sp.]MCW8954238.1 proton-conducting transporter membrane subunit [Sulfurimonas sp.]MCW9066842.1 proton-conducting transporter membrane subunit [Sulfurimonas sp.]
MTTYSILIIAPLLFAFSVLFGGLRVRNVLTVVFVLFLAGVSLTNIFLVSSSTQILFSPLLHYLFILLDSIVLIYFLWQGVIKKHNLVTFFALLQMMLYAAVVFFSSSITSSDILIDEISSTMYLVINIVGGIIIVYALGYIESEKFSRFKKNGFIALLFFFLSIMNFIVSTNNIEIFFLLFELTTLCSYILIAYHGDEVSSENALKALWINQIGGVAILIALIVSITQYDTVYFDMLINNINELYLLPIVFLTIAAFVKGASIPFDKWLLGAMVAPTPVSAMLHSATMVKIAPYLMLKLAPAMSGFVSLSITLIGTFVFFSASLLALSKDYFKEILGLSTIALLALMMALAAIGTKEATTACLVLIVFHAISKALLFLQAAILEKSFNLKYVNDINGLINHSPFVVLFIVVGFASLTLPPFGAFVAKFMAIESIANEIGNNPLYVLALIFIALGSVFLTLLYFKVLTKLLAKDVSQEKEIHVDIPKLFTVPSFALLALLVMGVYVLYEKEFLTTAQVFVPVVLIAVVPLLFATLLFKKAHRVKEYHCGEKEEPQLNMYYFEIARSYKMAITVVATVLILVLILGAML